MQRQAPGHEMIDRCRMLIKAYGDNALLVLPLADARESGMMDIGSVPIRWQCCGRAVDVVEIPATKALELLLGR